MSLGMKPLKGLLHLSKFGRDGRQTIQTALNGSLHSGKASNSSSPSSLSIHGAVGQTTMGMKGRHLGRPRRAASSSA
jgi:hypothetical protein